MKSKHHPVENATESRLASSLIKTFAPKGALPEKAYRADELRQSGLEYEAIGKELGISKLTAKRLASLVRGERRGS